MQNRLFPWFLKNKNKSLLLSKFQIQNFGRKQQSSFINCSFCNRTGNYYCHKDLHILQQRNIHRAHNRYKPSKQMKYLTATEAQNLDIELMQSTSLD